MWRGPGEPVGNRVRAHGAWPEPAEYVPGHRGGGPVVYSPADFVTLELDAPRIGHHRRS